MNPDEQKDEESGTPKDAPIKEQPEKQADWQDSKSPAQQQLDKPHPRKWLFIVLVILLILVLLLFGWLWWKNRDTNNSAANTNTAQNDMTPAPAEGAPPTCATGFTNYENASLGFGFCYPTIWGSVTVADAKFAAADVGSRWRIGFSAKESVNLGVVSADWATTVPRDGTCVDPAQQTLPAFSPFSTTWAVDGSPVSSATRGIEVLADEYLINEEVDNLLGNGVCLRGFTVIAGTYPHSTASYSAEFNATVTNPDQHIADPTVLIAAVDRADFATFVKSVYKVE